MPKISLQIIDLAHDHETNDVQIGQSLELQIVAEYSAQQQREFSGIGLPPLPDFRATSLVAKTWDKQNYVHLLDTRGCPTDVSVFPGMERVRTNSRNVLKARFHAFKFAGTSMVNFDVKIHFCANRCPDDNCLSATNNANWFPITTEPTTASSGSSSDRQKRQISNDQQLQKFKVQNPVYISTVTDVVNLPETANNTSANMPTSSPKSDTIPLNLNLHVRGPDNTNSNSFIYGERGILLIAGIGKDIKIHNSFIFL